MLTEHAEELVARDGLRETLGIEVVELHPERVAATMPVTPRHQQPWGYLGGGANLAPAEIVARAGGTPNCPPGKAPFGMGVNPHPMRPVREGPGTAGGVPLHPGAPPQAC